MSLKGNNYKTAKEFYYPSSNHSSRISNTSVIINQKRETELETELETGVNVSLEWSVKKYKNSGNPEVWGSAFWFTLHNGAIRYPMRASPIIKERMKGFVLGFPFMIPCLECKEHAVAYIEGNFDKLDDVCSGRMKLFNFFVDLHNDVNKRYNKPIMGYEEAYDLYKEGATVSKFSYN